LVAGDTGTPVASLLESEVEVYLAERKNIIGRVLSCLGILAFVSASSALFGPSALAGTEQILTLESDDPTIFSGGTLTLITDRASNITGAKVYVKRPGKSDFVKALSLSELQDGYTLTKWFHKVFSIRMTPSGDGEYDLEISYIYDKRLDAAQGRFREFRARLRRGSDGQRYLESRMPGKAGPFRQLKLIANKTKKQNGKTEFFGLKDCEVSAMLELNKLVASVGPGVEEFSGHDTRQAIRTGAKSVSGFQHYADLGPARAVIAN